jgi:glutaredoxin 2
MNLTLIIQGGSMNDSNSPRNKKLNIEPVATATAEVYIKQGLYQEALKIYREILKTDSLNSEIKNKLSFVEELINKNN